MSSYQDPSCPAGFGGFQGQDGTWDSSVGMRRSDSQSTNCTVDSSYTISTSGYSSATDYSSADAVLVADGNWQETCPYPEQYPYNEFPDTSHVLSATGSQYQQSDHQLPQTLHLSSPLQPFSTQAGIEDAARQSTLAANSLIINPQLFPRDGGPSRVSCQDIEEAIRRHHKDGIDEPIRRAVEDVLYQQLYPLFGDTDHYYSDITRILDEAAYQLQSRLQGPDVIDTCFYSLAAVLVKVTRDMRTDMNGAGSASADLHISDSPPTQSSTKKEKFRCNYPGCKKGASRQADLERHYKIVHLDDEDKIKHRCDYKKCNRHTNPFFRQDHFRDHLRIYHLEDLLRRGNKGDEKWWASRAPHALYNGWWRCSRCLTRVGIAKYGFVCSCGSTCEKERQQYRMATAGARF